MNSELDIVKDQKWFYEFNLPDGTKTQSYIPSEVRPIHDTRTKALKYFLNTISGCATGLDISCHEGFYSVILAEHLKNVTGLDKNAESLKKAKLITNVLKKNICFEHSSLEEWDINQSADFVLCFGLLYHVENTVQLIRKLAALTKKALCIETQVLPYDINGSIENGSYLWQRDIVGSFGLCVEDAVSAEGGLTDLAVIPSRRALEFLLKHFGFKKIVFYKPDAEDYEQFTRNHRVIILAEK